MYVIFQKCSFQFQVSIFIFNVMNCNATHLIMICTIKLILFDVFNHLDGLAHQIKTSNMALEKKKRLPSHLGVSCSNVLVRNVTSTVFTSKSAKVPGCLLRHSIVNQQGADQS